jgi:soluble lytic murein transglycosylase-like protein
MRVLCVLGMAALVSGAGTAAAYADIYSYFDAAGGVHYSNVPVDPRYRRLLAEPPDPAHRPQVLGLARNEVRRRAALYSALIDDVARRAQLQPALLCAVIAIESAFDPRAVSRKGAQGLMQLRPATAKRYGVQRPFDPAENVRGGAGYLKDLLKRYGNDLELALAAYNAGEDAVDRHGRTIPPFAETQAYVPAVLTLYRELSGSMGLNPYQKTLLPST